MKRKSIWKANTLMKAWPIIATLIVLLAACGSTETRTDTASAATPKASPIKRNNEPRGMNETSREPNPSQPESFRILVKKGERKLYLYEIAGGKERLRKMYRIALGNNPTGHKQRQGDGATPEGEYYITHRNPKSNFYLSLGVSYPNIADAAAGLQNGLLTKAQHDVITRAIRNKEKPPQNTKLGGDIFIHGGGSNSDWTLGCVALENADIKELFDLLPIKTPVRIEP